jgi:dipeptidyl aminopeptidase/acylaminoacyl peptidase
VSFISPPDTFVYEYDWTPDSAAFVATAAKGDGDAQWWVAKLESIDRKSGASRVLSAPSIQISYPRVSPDGKIVVFIGGLMSDFDQVGGDLYSVPIGGGEPRNLITDWKGSFTSLEWRRGALVATALVGEATMIFAVNPSKGGLTRLWSGPVSIAAQDLNGALSLSANGARGATVAQAFDRAPAILTGPLRALRPVTHDNDVIESEVSVQSVTWETEGLHAQGWLLRPRGTETHMARPMIVVVHGGPSHVSAPIFQLYGVVHTLIRHGYLVFEPNPRGSYGQGEAFTRGNVQDFGGGDFRDILAGVDAVERIVSVDDARLGVYGHSYGGFMAMWAVTHTGRFHAAVAGAGISDWMSYYGENGINSWMIPFFGASAYDRPVDYDRVSPIRTIRSAATPTLLYVGERDIECPPDQSLEFWNGLRSMGVPTSLTIYPGEGHVLSDPKDVNDAAGRIARWFDM